MEPTNPGTNGVAISFVLNILAAFIPAAIASLKGRKAGRWWLYGLITFPIALIHSIVIKNESKTKVNTYKPDYAGDVSK